MRIENVNLEDATELLEIYKPYVEKTAVSFEIEPPTPEEFSERIKQISSKYPYLKAVDDNGKILGFTYASTFRPRKAYDWNVETTIYIREDCRRKGVGRALYTELENRLCNMGVLNMNACVAFTSEGDEHLTTDSELFHKKMGYSLVGVFHKSGYKFNSWYDMCWMEKLIGEHNKNQKQVNFINSLKEKGD